MTSPLPTESPKRKPLTLGPGTLVLGSVGTQLDMSCQLTEVTITPEGDSEDSEAVLCGDVMAGERNYTWTLSGSVFQDLETDGVIDWTWRNAGAEVPFKFVPNATGSAAVTGRTVVDPLALGGTVKTRNKSDFEWGIVGAPLLNLDAAATEPAA